MYATANTEDGARLDIFTAGFWGSRFQKAYLDVKVFNPNASSYRGSQTSSYLRKINGGSMSSELGKLRWHL